MAGGKYVCRRCGRIVWNINPPETWNGTVLCRGESAPDKPPPDPPLNRGVGTEIKRLLESLGVTADACPGLCEQLRQEWDRAGVQWCREHRDDVLVPRLREAYRSTDWPTAIKAAANASATREIALAVLPHIRPWRPVESAIEGLCEVAMRRAELDADR